MPHCIIFVTQENLNVRYDRKNFFFGKRFFWEKASDFVFVKYWFFQSFLTNPSSSPVNRGRSNTHSGDTWQYESIRKVDWRESSHTAMCHLRHSESARSFLAAHVLMRLLFVSVFLILFLYWLGVKYNGRWFVGTVAMVLLSAGVTYKTWGQQFESGYPQ